jgi:hypothetical protein
VRSQASHIHNNTSEKALALSSFQSFLNCSTVFWETSANNQSDFAFVFTAVSIAIQALVTCVPPASAFIQASTNIVEKANKSALENRTTLQRLLISFAKFSISHSFAL